MTVFSHAVSGGGFLAGKQVFPVDYEVEASQRFLDALSSGDLRSASELSSDPLVDVNFVGAVCLKLRKADLISREDSPIEVLVEYEDFKADVTALFLAVLLGNVAFVRKLLSMGADVNQKLFRGFATTAAVREGQIEILEILLKAGASQPACEEALLEASCHGWAGSAELLMGTDLIRPHIAVHAFVNACSRGFSDVVSKLMKCGVDVNATDRVLLLSSKPSLHANIDCTALAAAIVSRQVSVVRMLLQAGARTDVEVSLGAWSWDAATGEELRVGAGLAEPYELTWCAVEYFETSGAILKMLLNKLPQQTSRSGRTLLHHAILCGNLGAVDILLCSGADFESPVKTTSGTEFRPIHMAARLGSPAILLRLIQAGCDLDSRTDSNETALMICSKHKREDCLRLLAASGADFGLLSNEGESAASIASNNRWLLAFQRAVLSALRDGNVPCSSNQTVFSPLLFATQLADTEALKTLISRSPSEIDIDSQDNVRGYTAVMAAAIEGHVDAFRMLVHAGANVKLRSKAGDTAITLSEISHKRDLFEKVMLEYALQQGSGSSFDALHCAARRGDAETVKLLTAAGKGYDINVADGEGYTPLMLAAKEGHANVCRLLIALGAKCDAVGPKGVTVISLARKEAEKVILDELARVLVLRGGRVMKHTKGGKGCPHEKTLKMVRETGVLQWGVSRRRNVVCREAGVGGNGSFRKGRRGKGDAEDAGLFYVATTRNKEVHFVCDGGREEAELWVRGIKLVTKDAIFGGGQAGAC